MMATKFQADALFQFERALKEVTGSADALRELRTVVNDAIKVIRTQVYADGYADGVRDQREGKAARVAGPRSGFGDLNDPRN